MKLLVLKPFLVAKTNGGEISLLERLLRLQGFGAQVKIEIAVPEALRMAAPAFLESMGTPLRGENYEVDGISCHIRFDENFHPSDLKKQKFIEDYFRVLLEKEKPDLVWVHYTDFFAVNAAIQWNKKKTWVLLTDNEYPRPSELSRFPSVAGSYLEIQTAVVASGFMRQSVKASLPWARSLKILNPVNADSYLDISASGDAYVFVNPTYVKGVDFVTRLAENLPQENFLFVGNWGGELPQNLPKNVQTVPQQKNLREVFSRAKAVLMPSVWQEAFGRLALEAMAAGVPVISSDRGNLPETVGEGGLVLPLELPLWLDAVRQSPDFFRELAGRGRQHYKAYRQHVERRYRALGRYLSLGR